MKKTWIVPLLLTLSVEATYAGIVTKTIKETVEAIDGVIVKKSPKLSDELVEGSEHATGLSLKPLEPLKETPEVDVVKWFNKVETNKLSSGNLLDHMPKGISNNSSFNNQVPFNDFWTWWISMKALQQGAQAWQTVSAEYERMSTIETLDSDVPLVDREQYPNFNYLVNPILVELENPEISNEDYTDSLAEFYDLLTVSGRATALKNTNIVDPERLYRDSFIGLFATSKAFHMVREEDEQAQNFDKYLAAYAEEYFTDHSIQHSFTKVNHCLSFLYTVDQINYSIYPGSQEYFTKYCLDDSLVENYLSLLDLLDTKRNNIENDPDVLERVQAMEVVTRSFTALLYSLRGDKDGYYLQRNKLFEILSANGANKDYLLGSLPLLSLTEASFGNFKNAFQLAALTISLAEEEPELLVYETTFLVGLYAFHSDYRSVKELIEIQQTMAHPESKYFVPATSKLALAASLLALEYRLQSLQEL